MRSFLENLRQEILAWGKDRWWFPRALLTTLLAWIGFELLADTTAWNIFAPVNLGIHETGHLVFRLTGIQILEIAGGSIAQVAAPVALIVSFLRQPDLFAPAFGIFWLGTNLCNISVYMADARARALPLVTVGGGEHIIHDWQFLLKKAGLLTWDTWLGEITWALSVVVMFAGCAYGFWVCTLIPEANGTPTAKSEY